MGRPIDEDEVRYPLGFNLAVVVFDVTNEVHAITEAVMNLPGRDLSRISQIGWSMQKRMPAGRPNFWWAISVTWTVRGWSIT